MRLPKFLLKMIPGFYIKDMKEWLKKGYIDIYLEHRYSNKESTCHKCQTKLSRITGNYRQKIQSMPIMNYKTFLYVKRRKGHCSNCKKIRAEHLEFISPETPHLTREYSWWLGRMCEIAPVSRVGELTGIDQMTMWRLDFARLKRMLQNYKIPKVRRISVDEVYARKKKYGGKESRDKRFFTVICDLDTRRVIWVSDSRERSALDDFFNIIGPDRCKEIDVVAMDQHDSYRISVEQNCPMATVVWDRFHIMQTFNEAINGDRQWLSRYVAQGESKRLTRSKFKHLFVKRSDRRTKVEQRHIRDVLRDNEDFAFLELIKEGMHQLYDSDSSYEAREKFEQIGEWIDQCSNFHDLKKWWKNFNNGWDTFKNYFHYRVSSALSEGQNNAIKALKRRGFGYRNMPYFKLKILQVCGFLNSRYVPMSF
jgi:transposase